MAFGLCLSLLCVPWSRCSDTGFDSRFAGIERERISRVPDRSESLRAAYPAHKDQTHVLPRSCRPEEAFSHGAVNVFHARPRWGWGWKGGKSQRVVDLGRMVQEVTVWENGHHTGAWAEVQRLIADLPKQDIAADRRRQTIRAPCKDGRHA